MRPNRSARALEAILRDLIAMRSRRFWHAPPVHLPFLALPEREGPTGERA